MTTRPDELDAADVVIVGAGAGGSVAASRLVAAGLRVVCLEQGDWPDRSTQLSDTPEADLAWVERWSPDPNARRLPGDYPLIADDSVISPVNFNGVGGSMVQWAGMWHPLLPSDFRTASLDGVGDDWPISFDDLLPYYERVTREMGVSGLGGDPAYPPMADPPNPPLPIGRHGRRAAEGMNALGWHWWPGANAIASRPHGRLGACTRRGTCMIGCPDGAKADPGEVYWRDTLENGVVLVTGARVREVTLERTGRATGVVWLDRDGGEHFQRGRAVVLACGGIGTPRLLLMSTSARFPDGLANRSGLVGRRLMQHPYVTTHGIFDDEMSSWEGPYGQILSSFEFAETDEARGFVRGAKWGLTPGGGPVFTNLVYVTAQEDQSFDALWGDAFGAHLRESVGRTCAWGAQIEDLPSVDNRVELDAVAVDSSGLPAARLTYRVDDNALTMIGFMTERMTEAMDAAGARRIMTTPVWRSGIGHTIGTARMGDDPATSVTDADGRCHDVENLFILDGSLFVTGGSVNPGATILALAHRGVDRMLASGFDRRGAS